MQSFDRQQSYDVTVTATLPQPPEGDPALHLSSCCCENCLMPSEPDATTGGEASSGTATDANGTTTASLQEMADFLRIDFWNNDVGVRHNVGSTGIDANNGVLHYNVAGYSDLLYGGGTDADGISEDRAELVRDAFDIFSATLGIEFVETTSEDQNVVDFFFSDNQSGAYAGSPRYSDGTIHYSYINVDAGWSGGTSTYDDYTLQTILHEIGHALGLGHQGNYNGSGSYASSATYEYDSWQASMMSYFSQAENTAIDASFEFLQTPMAVDWIALDDIYGAFGYGTDNAFTGDTVYGFNTTISADVSKVWNAYATYADQTASTIVDGDGIDTLDFSGFDADQRIDLTVQYATDTAQITSDIGGRVGNLTLGIGTVIENAVSGGGDDVITGNAADNTLLGGAGDDTLTGAGGDDTLRGGDGMDTAVFAGAFGDYDFTLSAGDTELWIASLGGDDGLDTIATDIEFLQFGDGAASTLVLGGSGLIASVETTDETGATIAAITRADDGSTVAEEYVAGVLSIRETVEADGDVKTLSYDAGGRLDTVAFEDFSDIRNWESYSNAYDDTGSRIAYDLLLDNGRIHNRTYQDGVLATHATTEADGDIRLRTYDDQGRTDSVTVQDISQTRSWESYSNSYDESGDRIAYDITFDNGKVHNRTYQDGTLATHTITDANGDTRTSTYDSAGRLDSFEFRDDSQTRSWESYTNTYDDAGNRKAYDVAYDSGQTLNRAFTDGILASQTVIEVDGDVKTTTYRADGAREMFVFEDVSDSRNWESYTDTFDEAGGFIDREYVWDVA